MKSARLPSVSVVIPVFNNEQTAKDQLETCYKLLNKLPLTFEIILLNDASTDGSLRILRQFSLTHPHVRLLNHKINLGIAASLKDLYSASRYKYTLLFSIDGQWNPADIISLIIYLADKKLDVVIGRRLQKKYPPCRKLISYLYNMLPKILFGVDTVDAGSIKIFRTDLHRHQKYLSHSVFMEAEMLIKAKDLRYSVGSIPVSHYRKRSDLKSGVNLNSIYLSLYDALKIKFHRK